MKRKMEHEIALTDTDTYGKKTSHRAHEMDDWRVARNLLGALWFICVVVAFSVFPAGQNQLKYAVAVGSVPPLLLLGVVIWLFLITGERTKTEEVIIKPRHVETPAETVVKETTSIELHIGKNQIVHAEIPGPYRAIVFWCRAAVNDASLAYGTWQDHFQTRGRDKRICYAEYRQWWVQAGHAVENGQQGMDILWDNNNTRAFIEAIARCDPNDETTPLLEQPHVQKALEAPAHAHTHAHRLTAGRE